MARASFSDPYTGEDLNHIAFPLGGIGAGMFCIEGNGGFSDFAFHHRPEAYAKKYFFAALSVKGVPQAARVLEGPVPDWRVYGPPYPENWAELATGGGTRNYGLPRFDAATFQAQFPFATVAFEHPSVPLTAEVTGWSPFTPGDADASCLPMAALEYRFSNPTNKPLEAVFSFHAQNIMKRGNAPRGVDSVEGGFLLWQEGTEEQPWQQGALVVAADDPAARVNCQWFRGDLAAAWRFNWESIANGEVIDRPPFSEGEPSDGGSLYVPFTLQPGEEKVIRLRCTWYVPVSNLRAVGGEDDTRCDRDCACACRPTHVPWYAGRFDSIQAVDAYWKAHLEELRARTVAFRDAFYDTTLPPEVIEATGANLAILKTPTLLRQSDGRLWCWEGCCDCIGCCPGACTHVWNYAQAVAHLFPELERTLRQTEFHENQDARGHQVYRSFLPVISVENHSSDAAADGQLGGIMKVYRDWRISGDTAWLRDLWPRVRQSMLYSIEAWDPDHLGTLVEPQHNTYDIGFWGPNSMCTSIYLGALLAAARMAEALGEDAALFNTLAVKARLYLENELYDGEYFYQRTQWEGLRAEDPVTNRTKGSGWVPPEIIALLQQEGPFNQYGRGCLSDGVLGVWMAEVSGLGGILDAEKTASHLRAVHRYNFTSDLSNHASCNRPSYALGHEGGLLLCTWPKGGKPTMPFTYNDEVWTGIEYQVAAHLIMTGAVDEGLEIVRAVRSRYDGKRRNPFDEYECGHWYGRALSSYSLLQALSGARYDAVERVLYLQPRVQGDFRAFLCTATGFGTVGVRDGQPFLEVREGEIAVELVVVD